MIAVAQCHKGTLKWIVIDLSLDLDQSVSPKKLSGFGPDDIGPPPGFGLFISRAEKDWFNIFVVPEMSPRCWIASPL